MIFRVLTRAQGKVEVLRHDPDHGPAAAFDHHRRAQDFRGAAEAPLPDAVAQNDDGVVARPVLFLGEPAAQRRTHSEYSQVIRGGSRSEHPFGVAAGRTDVEARVLAGSQLLECRGLLPPVQVVAGGH